MQVLPSANMDIMIYNPSAYGGSSRNFLQKVYPISILCIYVDKSRVYLILTRVIRRLETIPCICTRGDYTRI